MARALWHAMVKVWVLPSVDEIVNTGQERLLGVLIDIQENESRRLLMVLWLCWHVRSEAVHEKPAPHVEASQ